ncbi:unnamed protein product [Parnassius apollo]|uniref:(apollo) hypothetical protein n=1 Tax=Parnassius apollo TaxID=110799 RepID=A0A8S3W0S4_PARAO|nr:unnamed protein product [Parnassius apollo]
MSWTNDVVLEFLDLYKREDILWDPKNPLHRNRREISEAWTRIQTSLSINCSVQDLKKKKESLMTSFRMHWNRKKKSLGNYHTTWFAYPCMESFLSEKYECDSTEQLENEFFNNTIDQSQQQQISSELNIGQRYTTTERNNDVKRYTRSTVSTNTTNNKTNKTSNSNYDHVYTKKETNEDERLLRLPTERRDIDEYDLYGQLLAKKLRKLEEHQRDVAMHEIDNIMFRAKMQSSTSQARSFSSSPSPVPRKMKSPVFIVTQQNHQQYEDENIPYQEHMQPQAPS